MKRKLFTLLTLALLGVGSAWAGDVYKISFNGSNAEFKNGESVDAGKFFSWNSAKHNFNTKFNGCTYDGVEYTSGLKMEGATKVSWTSAAESTVTIVQSTWSDKTIKFDDTELAVADAEAITGGRVYTITSVAAGSHSVTRGSGESGIFAIIVEYTGTTLTQLDSPTFNVNTTTGEVTIGSVANATKVTYTTDGTDPTDESTTYENPFTVDDGTVVKAIAIGDLTSYSHSDVVSVTVLLANVTPETPSINQYNGTVFISCATPSTTIEYSLDGTNYTAFTRAFTLSEDGTVYARAKRGEKYSDVASATVTTIGKGAANKTIWMGHGSFDNNDQNEMTGKSGDDAEGFKLAITGNTDKKWSSGIYKIKIGDIERTTIKLSNGAQNTMTFPTGVKATRMTLYSVINSAEARTSYWKEFNGTSINDEVPMGAWNTVSDRLTNPDVRVFELTGNETSITFTNAGEQLCFIIALDVIQDPDQITIGEAGYKTYYSRNALDFSGTGITAYVAKAENGEVTFTETTSAPAKTGLLLKGAAGTYEVPVTAAPANVTSAMEGVLVDTKEDAGIFVLFKDDSHPIGFYKTTAEFTVGANTAFFPADIAGISPSRSFIAIDDTATGISEVNTAENTGAIYNLNGVRVEKATKGLYIINGKKVLK